MLSQQQNYASKCTTFVGGIKVTDANGKDLTVNSQNALLALATVQENPLSAAQSAIYFPGVTSSFWGAPGLVDYYAAYNAMVALAVANSWAT